MLIAGLAEGGGKCSVDTDHMPKKSVDDRLKEQPRETGRDAVTGLQIKEMQRPYD